MASERNLREKVADMLAHNDACGPGPVSRQEYLDDADVLVREVVREIAEALCSLKEPVPVSGGWLSLWNAASAAEFIERELGERVEGNEHG